jgi:hypothetical protein
VHIVAHVNRYDRNAFTTCQGEERVPEYSLVDEPDVVQHECPMCGERMRLRRHERVRRIPGHPEERGIEVLEWECPECDYFEEFEDPGPGKGP